MAVEVGTGYVSITPSAKGFGASLSKQIDGEVSGAGTAAGGKAGKGFLGGMGGALKAGVAAVGVGAVIGLASSAAKAAQESARVAAITDATIKATGGAANVTAAEVGKLAAALSMKTGIDDEQIQTGQNMLLTFKNVANAAGEGNDVFNQASEAALNLSAAGFGSVESASVMLGKALNDPLKGMAALGRAGVTFTESQKEQVKAAMANNDILSAQKIILGEVEGQVGGVAEAAADPMAKLQVMFGNLMETVGTSLLPAINAIVDALGPVFEAIGPPIAEVAGILGGVLADAVKTLSPILAPLAQHVGKVASLLGGALGRVVAALAPLIIALLNALMPILEVFLTLIEPVLELVAVLAEALVPILTPLIDLIALLAGLLADGLGWVINTVIAPALQWLSDLISTNVGPAMASLIEWFQPVIDWFNSTAMPVLKAAWDGILQAIQPVIAWIQTNAAPIMQAVASAIGLYYSTLWTVVQFVWNAIYAAIERVVSWFQSYVMPVVRVVATLMGAYYRTLWTVVKTVWDGIYKAIEKVVQWWQNTAWPTIQRVTQLVITGFQVMKAGVEQVWQMIQSAISTAINNLKTVLGGIQAVVTNVIGFFQRMYDGVVDKVQGLVTWFGGLAGKILSAVGSLGSTLYSTGVAVIQGFINGVLSMASTLWSTIYGFITENIPDPVKRALGIASPSKVMRGYGRDTVDGLIDGIESRGKDLERAAEDTGDAVIVGLIRRIQKHMAQLTKTANSVTRIITRAMKTASDEAKKNMQGELDAYRKRIDGLRAVGNSWLDFVRGLRQTTPGLAQNLASADRLYAKLISTMSGGKATTDKAIEQAGKLADQLQTKLGAALEQAQADLQAAQDAFNGFADEVANAVTGAISFQEAYRAGEESGLGFLEGLRAQAERAAEFAAMIRQLVAQGLSEAALRQVLAAGAEAGSNIAAELLQGGAAAINEANELVASVDELARELGVDAATEFYGAGVENARAQVQGIMDQIAKMTPELMRVMDRVARKMSREILVKLKLDPEQMNLRVSIRANNGEGVPAMAEGGIVTKPTLALIGEAGPEAVIPLSKMGGGRGVTIEEMNVYAAPGESVQREATPRALRRMAYVAGL